MFGPTTRREFLAQNVGAAATAMTSAELSPTSLPIAITAQSPTQFSAGLCIDLEIYMGLTSSLYLRHPKIFDFLGWRETGYIGTAWSANGFDLGKESLHDAEQIKTIASKFSKEILADPQTQDNIKGFLVSVQDFLRNYDIFYDHLLRGTLGARDFFSTYTMTDHQGNAITSLQNQLDEAFKAVKQCAIQSTSGVEFLKKLTTHRQGVLGTREADDRLNLLKRFQTGEPDIAKIDFSCLIDLIARKSNISLNEVNNYLQVELERKLFLKLNQELNLAREILQRRIRLKNKEEERKLNELLHRRSIHTPVEVLNERYWRGKPEDWQGEPFLETSEDPRKRTPKAKFIGYE